MEERKSGNPLWLLLAIPVFFLVWYLAGLGFAFIAGLSTLALCYVVLVWLPDDQARKLNRTERFVKARLLIRANRKEIGRIRDTTVKGELNEAILTFEGLVNALAAKPKYQGIIEDKLVPSLEDLAEEVTKWIGHESGEYPMSVNESKELRNILTHKDDLFRAWQKNGIDTTSYLTAKYRSRTEMESAGINIDDGGDR